MDFLSEQVQYLGLIFSRLMALFSVAPIFSSPNIAVRTRITLAFLLAIILYPVVTNYLNVLPDNLGAYMLLLLSQVIVGILIGFMILILFVAFQMSGDLFAMQMGLSMSEVLDPQSNISTPIIGILKNAIATLLFLAIPFSMDGYYAPAFLHAIRVIAYSFQEVPFFVLNEVTQFGVLQYLNQIVGLMFLTAMKLAIPMIGVLFISSLTLGILGKVAPQMNLVIMGIQINIIVGLFLLTFLLPVLIPIIRESFYVLYDSLGEMLQNWQ